MLSTPLNPPYGPSLDPRPDLESDSHLWTEVLLQAYHTDPHTDKPQSIFGLLHGLRCGGATLLITSTGTLRLDYSALVAAGIWSNKELRSAWLLPAADFIKRIFAVVEANLAICTNQPVKYKVAAGL